MKRYTGSFAVLLILSLLSTSCIEDLRNFESVESFEYSPSFSVPIGPLSYTLAEIMPSDSLGDFGVPDSLLSYLGDTSIIVYPYSDDSLFFYNPEIGFETSYTEPVNFSNLSGQSENVRSAMVKTNMTNNLPVAFRLQAYFLNDQGEIIDSISKGGRIIIERPEINAEGNIVKPTKQTIYTHYKEDNIDDLMAVTQLEISLYLDTYTEGIDTLFVYPHYGLALQFGLRADLMVPITP